MRAKEQGLALLAGKATAGAVLALDSRTQAAHQTAVYAAPTMAAMITRAAVQAARQGQEQANRESTAEFWRWLRWLSAQKTPYPPHQTATGRLTTAKATAPGARRRSQAISANIALTMAEMRSGIE